MPSIRRPDGIRGRDDVGAPVLIPPHGKREAEGENETDDPEQRPLQDADRLTVSVRVLPQVVAGDHSDRGRTPDHREHNEPQLPGVQGEEHAWETLTRANDRSDSGSVRPAQIPGSDNRPGTDPEVVQSRHHECGDPIFKLVPIVQRVVHRIPR